MTTPQEIANAATFLASPASSFTTGSNLIVVKPREFLGRITARQKRVFAKACPSVSRVSEIVDTFVRVKALSHSTNAIAPTRWSNGYVICCGA
jgi:hypothetical protein